MRFDKMHLTDQERILSVTTGLANLSRETTKMTLDAEEELWGDFSEGELRERADKLWRLEGRAQLTDEQRALVSLMRGRLRRRLKAMAAE